MRSIERRFKEIENKNPFWSSYICFAEAVKGQKFSRRTISIWFSKLVEKSDYGAKDKKALITNLEALSKIAEDG